VIRGEARTFSSKSQGRPWIEVVIGSGHRSNQISPNTRSQRNLTLPNIAVKDQCQESISLSSTTTKKKTAKPPKQKKSLKPIIAGET